ncbi:MAG TPA: trehalose-phosphatase [Burkholderiales bacterium]|nr:trehalose-phosphatase [Burkholderiales bacterium]
MSAAPRKRSRNGAPPPARADWAFFFDVDGTLLALAEHPAHVRTDDEVRSILRELHRGAGGALALISGRSIDEIDALFAPLRFPAAGQHGMERRDPCGAMQRHVQHSPRLAELRHRLTPIAARHPGVLLEDKGLTLAIHYRRAPRLAGYLGRRLREGLDHAEDLRVQRGKMVLEVKPGGRDKGSAILEFMSEPPFRGRIPVFLGDDVSDEFGFSVVNELGGHSIKVGAGATRARWRLSGVGAVRRWLGDCVAALNPAPD